MANIPLSGRAAGIVRESVDRTYGAALVGLIIAAVLLGNSLLQIYMYYHHFHKDSLLHKAGTGIIFGLAAFHLCLTSHASYYFLITKFGQYPEVLELIWSIKLQVLVNVVIMLLVQSLYAYRVWILGGYHNSGLKYIIVGVVVGGFVIGIVFVYCIYMAHTFVDISKITWAIVSAAASATFIDLIITFSMCHYLLKSKVGEVFLNSKISRIMQYVLSSGLLTCTGSVVVIMTLTLAPRTLAFLAMEFIMPQIYALSFLAMMNARRRSDCSTDLHVQLSHRVNLSDTSASTSSTIPRGHVYVTKLVTMDPARLEA